MANEDLKQDLNEAVENEEITADNTENADCENESADTQNVEANKEEANAEEEKSQKKSKKEKKDAKDALIEELQDKNKRQLAEFVNFRSRTEKEMAARYELGARDVVEKILPVVDNFERGFGTISQDGMTPFEEGMDKVFKQLMKVFEDMDVKTIEAVGAEFDPNLHNAVMHVEDDSVGENVIVEEFQKGYTYRGTVVRHSMVKVAN